MPYVISGDVVTIAAPSAEVYWGTLRVNAYRLPGPSEPGQPPVLDLMVEPPRIGRQARSQVSIRRGHCWGTGQPHTSRMGVAR